MIQPEQRGKNLLHEKTQKIHTNQFSGQFKQHLPMMRLRSRYLVEVFRWVKAHYGMFRQLHDCLKII
jgi:hypothetical protein